MSSDTKKHQSQTQAQAQSEPVADQQSPTGAALPQLGGSYHRDPKTGAVTRVGGTGPAQPQDRRNGPQSDKKGA